MPHNISYILYVPLKKNIVSSAKHVKTKIYPYYYNCVKQNEVINMEISILLTLKFQVLVIYYNSNKGMEIGEYETTKLESFPK